MKYQIMLKSFLALAVSASALSINAQSLNSWSALDEAQEPSGKQQQLHGSQTPFKRVGQTPFRKGDAQKTASDAAWENAIGFVVKSALGVGLVQGVRSNYTGLTTTVIGGTHGTAEELTEEMIEKIATRVQNSPLAGFGMGVLGGGDLTITYDEHRYNQSFGEKNAGKNLSSNALTDVLDEKYSAKKGAVNRGSLGVNLTQPEVATQRARAVTEIADNAKPVWKTEALNTRVFAKSTGMGTSAGAALGLKAKLTEIMKSGAHIRGVITYQGAIPKGLRVAAGLPAVPMTINIIVYGPAAADALSAAKYGIDSYTGYEYEYMAQRCANYDETKDMYKDCEESLMSWFSTSEWLFVWEAEGNGQLLAE